MRWYNLLLVILSYLLLAAHYIRPGNMFMALICIGLPFLLIIKRRFPLRIVQFGLIFGSFVWLGTIFQKISEYSILEKDITRMVIIISSVFIITGLTALLMNKDSVLEKYVK